MHSQSVLGKISELLLWSPARLIVELISNIALSMREKCCWLEEIDVFREGKESAASLPFADMQMFLNYWCYSVGRDCQVTNLACTYPTKPQEKFSCLKDSCSCLRERSTTKCDVIILQRRPGVSNKGRPDMTFALTILKKVVATFQNPAIHRIISESNSMLCTERNGQAGRLNASDSLCSIFHILHASQAGGKKIGIHKISEKLCNFWMPLRSASLQDRECGGSRSCAAGAVCGWLTEQPMYLYSSTVEMGMGPAECTQQNIDSSHIASPQQRDRNWE